MKNLINNKKGQMNISNALSAVLIIGLVFLVMATIALIGQKYGDALDVDNTAATAVNESVTNGAATTGVSATLSANSLENGVCGTITSVINGTGSGFAVGVGNFTQTGCNVVNNTAMTPYSTTLLFNYPYTYSFHTVATNVTGDLESEISNNTSIAGIILTISLVGIVLAILIGVFMGIGRRTRI